MKPSAAAAKKNLITIQGGSNDFDAPLLDAHSICQTCASEASEIVFYFMTDGVWSYPERAITTLLGADYLSKMEFLGVCFGHFDARRYGNFFFGGQGGTIDKKYESCRFPVV